MAIRISGPILDFKSIPFNRISEVKRTQQILMFLISIVLFAWLGIINIIVTCILIVSVTVGIVIITSQPSKEVTHRPFTVIPIVTSLICVILDAIIIIFSFKLSYLIMKNTKSNNHERI
ncbi:unnamed protein product [Rotaria sp. Silwood2]|nr:unnamed protein product [Rotaria sp. Silwood2]CAF2517940.1 unnamed protein product [Rotaria sp. Silwood2]CAF2755090.1 unnamed protein product [Rotaria sp. Silwood2]CAF2914071.1 unnamed protein product [Rotaria sp. Silwood2]CAF4235996.1 unnamed protein product [Rotaria sp. Silwood2]